MGSPCRNLDLMVWHSSVTALVCPVVSLSTVALGCDAIILRNHGYSFPGPYNNSLLCSHVSCHLLYCFLTPNESMVGQMRAHALKQHQTVLTLAAHLFKLGPYREERHGLCAQDLWHHSRGSFCLPSCPL
jgi:hypothetical protein